MPVIGLSIKTMEAKRIGEIKGEINVNSTPKITKTEEIQVSSIEKKALNLDFEFLTEYEPQIAQIKVTGSVVYVGTNNEDIIKKWKKDKKLPTEVSMEVLNYLFRRCLLKIALMADDLQLPPPLQIPRVQPAKKD